MPSWQREAAGGFRMAQMAGVGSPVYFVFGIELGLINGGDRFHRRRGGVVPGGIVGLVELFQSPLDGGQSLGFGLVVCGENADRLALDVGKRRVELAYGQGVIDRALGRLKLVTGGVMAVDTIQLPGFAFRGGVGSWFAIGAEYHHFAIGVFIADPGYVVQEHIIGDVFHLVEHVHMNALGLTEAVVDAADFDQEVVFVACVSLIGGEVDGLSQ